MLVVFFVNFGNMETDTQSKMVNVIYVALLSLNERPKYWKCFLAIFTVSNKIIPGVRKNLES